MSAAHIDPLALLGGEFGGFGGFDWAVPAFVMTVPGLLLILASSGFPWSGESLALLACSAVASGALRVRNPAGALP